MRFCFEVRISESAHVFFMILVMVIVVLVMVIVVLVMVVMLLPFMEDGPIRDFVILCVETGEAVANVKTTNISFKGCAESLSFIAGLLLSG